MIHLQISSGRGPRECYEAILHIRRRMLAEWPIARLVHAGEQSCVISLDGEGSDEYARSWEGTIQWVCKNPCGPRRPDRKNWFVGVKRIEVPEQAKKVVLLDKDLIVQTMRSSGKGGQNVNKVESKVRLTHLPSGIVVVSEQHRTQKLNLEQAKYTLVKELLKRQDSTFAAIDVQNWSNHNQLERGNPVRIFHGPKFEEP